MQNNAQKYQASRMVFHSKQTEPMLALETQFSYLFVLINYQALCNQYNMAGNTAIGRPQGFRWEAEMAKWWPMGWNQPTGVSFGLNCILEFLE